MIGRLPGSVHVEPTAPHTALRQQPPERQKIQWQRPGRPTLGPSFLAVPYRLGELIVDDEIKMSSISSGLNRKNELPDRILLVPSGDRESRSSGSERRPGSLHQLVGDPVRIAQEADPHVRHWRTSERDRRRRPIEHPSPGGHRLVGRPSVVNPECGPEQACVVGLARSDDHASGASAIPRAVPRKAHRVDAASRQQARASPASPRKEASRMELFVRRRRSRRPRTTVPTNRGPPP